MENKKWLPSDTRNRLIDLCKDRNISQAQLAGVIGIDRSALSRFLSGKTDSMSHEHVIAIAKYFNVSTDFLGETDDPGRINYDIGELGLTVKATECLYTRKVDPAILCRLLEQERCGELMHERGLYLDETMASGIAVQNQLFNSLSNLLNEHVAEHPEDKQAADAAAQTVLKAFHVKGWHLFTSQAEFIFYTSSSENRQSYASPMKTCCLPQNHMKFLRVRGLYGILYITGSKGALPWLTI